MQNDNEKILELITHGNHPTQIEREYLLVLYKRFFTIYDIMHNPLFWDSPPEFRLFNIKEMLSIYAEAIKYQPIKDFIESGDFPIIKNEFVGKLFTNLRHILSHFPIADSWQNITFKQSWLTLFDNNSQINKFLIKHKGKKYGFHITVPNFDETFEIKVEIPESYFKDEVVALSDIIPEKDGIMVCLSIISIVLGKQMKAYNVTFKVEDDSIS